MDFQRYHLFQDFIIDYIDLYDYVFLLDNEVWVNGNPWDFVNLTPHFKLYIASEEDIISKGESKFNAVNWLTTITTNCYGKAKISIMSEPLLEKTLLSTFFNEAIIGGKIEDLKVLIDKMIRILERIPNSGAVCGHAALNYELHTKFRRRDIFTKYQLHSRIFSFESQYETDAKFLFR